ncbi:MAG: class I SAM-dependent methyltransferase [Rikenellaceae bacterium]
MSKIATAERVSCEPSDNFVFQRSRLAYHHAASLISGKVLEIGTGSGYGVEILAPKAESFTTVDKFLPSTRLEGVDYIEACVPPLPFKDGSFDCVVSFQVIEHIKDDRTFVSEIKRVLRPGGVAIISTPNIALSLTRNPWHVREYSSAEFTNLLAPLFKTVEILGVSGNDKIMAYYEQNRLGVARFKRFDLFDLEHRLPRWILQIPYDILNRINRRKLLSENQNLTSSITMDDYSVSGQTISAFDLFAIARR